MSVPSAPRVCGDDPKYDKCYYFTASVLPAYAGMILLSLSLRSWSC